MLPIMRGMGTVGLGASYFYADLHRIMEGDSKFPFLQ